MLFAIGKKAWTLTFVEALPKDASLPDRDGECVWADRIVRVKDSLTPKNTMDTVVHEILHAYLGRSTASGRGHERVNELAGVITDVLWRMGYRRRR